jgi:hypothetical protein
MPDLMGHEFIQIREAVDIAFELTCGDPYPVDVTPEGLAALEAKLEKIRQARELMADLSRGNSR